MRRLSLLWWWWVLQPVFCSHAGLRNCCFKRLKPVMEIDKVTMFLSKAIPEKYEITCMNLLIQSNASTHHASKLSTYHWFHGICRYHNHCKYNCHHKLMEKSYTSLTLLRYRASVMMVHCHFSCSNYTWWISESPKDPFGFFSWGLPSMPNIKK